MIDGARTLPIQHLSIRVPWHDAGWVGTVCNDPANNTACRALKSIADTKDDAAETDAAGLSFADLAPRQLPPCIGERAAFMAPFPVTITKKHPYAESSPETHGHLRPTRFTMPPYSAACVPFRWMRQEESGELTKRYHLVYQPDRESQFTFGPDWIQDRSNQLVMLDTFFGAVRPEQSLCFFYAKDSPLSAAAGRVIVGVGLVRSVHESVEYEYSTRNPPHRSVIWERNIEHSIRPDWREGFVFPYQKLFDAALEKGIDPEQFVAFAPDEAFWSFSYVSEHVSNDHAIAAVLQCLRALEKIEAVFPELLGPWRRMLEWLDGQLNRLWRMRGPFPGFGSALAAFLGTGGNLVAYELAEECAAKSADEKMDPWPAFERVVQSPERADGAAKKVVGEGFARAWQAMAADRKELLKLLSRFSLEAPQAGRFFNPDQRPAGVDDSALLNNPYLLYEIDRFSEDPVFVSTIDRGMLPDQAIREAYPLSDRSRLEDKVDPRRVRALMVAALEQAGEDGHTLLPRERLTSAIERMPLDTDCPIGPDVLAGMVDVLDGEIEPVEMGDGSRGYQLRRMVENADLIRRTVKKRVGDRSRRHEGAHEFRKVVDDGLRDVPSDDSEAEEKARIEKTAALEELFASRFSVLVGAAGTGKTKLLKMLCSLPEVESGGMLLLAPTGKARVQMEKGVGMPGGFTLAQFLMEYDKRYDPKTGRYMATGSAKRCSKYRTVIVDECSMLTEEQLAALLDALTGVDRLVLVGDTRQLPPIGSGRPFVDIVRELEPDNVEHIFPRVGRGYAELTAPRRQQGKIRADLRLAGWFGGNPDPAADEIWDSLESENRKEIRFESWADADELREKLLRAVVEELELEGIDDELGFECSLGATMFNGNTFFWRSRDPETQPKAEQWQIISPVRGATHGVEALNRFVQQTFRKTWLRKATATATYRKVNPPIGRQGIIYGDKVINLANNSKRKVYPERESYVANGDVGLVVGNYKTRRQSKVFPFLEVEFTSQPGYDYDFWDWEFIDKSSPPLELAYALTVHKTQGSEFGTTLIVLPDPCWLLSRELLYTAMTRQRNRVVILHQGAARDLRKYANETYSEVARRLTNLFAPSKPVSCDVEGCERFLEERLIHRTKRGDLVRSKSEVIIANELLAQDVSRYEYESPLKLPNGETRYPDFTIIDDDTGERYYWEHLGLLHNPDYKERWEQKLASYRKAGIIPHGEGGKREATLVVTRDEPNGGIDSEAIANLIEKVLGP